MHNLEEKKSDGTKATILTVDDQPINLEIVVKYLENAGFKVNVASDGETALARAKYLKPDIILLDIQMPGIDGFETCRRLKADEETRDIPVIFLTGRKEVVDKVMGFQVGAVDYLTKPVDTVELQSRITAQLEINRYRKGLEEKIKSQTLDLKESEEKYRTLFSQASDAIIILENEKVIDCNEKTLKLFACTRDQILGMALYKKFSPEKQPDQEDSTEKALRLLNDALKGELVDFDWQHLKYDGSGFSANIRLSVVEIKSKKYIQAILHDTTEKKKLEKMEAALRQSAKMAEIGALVAGVSHEIKNPLHVIFVSIELVKMAFAGNKAEEKANRLGYSPEDVQKIIEALEIDEYLNDIHKYSKRIKEIVDNMLNFSRMPSGGFLKYDLLTVVKETFQVAKYNRAFSSIINIEIECEKDIPKIPCQKNEIQQVILNIVSNGAEAMIEKRKSDLSYIPNLSVNLFFEHDMASIQISDNGPGIDDETIKTIFEPFFSTKLKKGGTGLGLYICRQIIEKNHQGTITVDSEIGQGTAFTIKLPLNRSSAGSDSTGEEK